MLSQSPLRLEKVRPSDGQTVFKFDLSNSSDFTPYFVAVANTGSKDIYITGNEIDSQGISICIISISQQRMEKWKVCTPKDSRSSLLRMFIDREADSFYLMKSIISPEEKLTTVHLFANSGANIWEVDLPDEMCKDGMVTVDGNLVVKCENTLYKLNKDSGIATETRSIYEKDHILIDSANHLYHVRALSDDYEKTSISVVVTLFLFHCFNTFLGFCKGMRSK